MLFWCYVAKQVAGSRWDKKADDLHALLFFISGGNGNAAMIAALSLEEENLSETILTCSFAQKVARVVNEPR